MVNILKDGRYKSIPAFFCALGWSLAYPLIKIGYRQFQIAADDLGGKILFAGIRFFFAGALVLAFCLIGKTKSGIKSKKDCLWLILFAAVNTTLHYMFAYIGLGYNPSARSTILDSMGGFFLIILSTVIFSDDKITASKIIGCVLGIAGIVSINIQPGENFFENITLRGDGMILLNACCALGTLKESMSTFTNGASDLSSGIKDYTDGAKKLNDGLRTLNASVGTLSKGATTLDASAKTIAAGVRTLDQALNTEMSDTEKEAAKKQVSAQFAEGSDTYQYIYNAAATNFAGTMTSDATVGQIQSGISGMGLTSDGVIAALAQYYASNGFVDATTGKKYSAEQCQATVPGTSTTYAAYFASTVLKGGLAQGIAGGIATSGADAVGKSVVSACESAAQTAAVQGAENAKKTIASQIEAVDKTSGYSLVSGTSALSKGISTLAAGVPDLVAGVDQLASGADTLVANNEKLKNGASDLSDGANKIADGVDKLDDGADELYNGVVKFNEEGISKLVDAFNGDAKDLIDRIDAVVQAGENYTTFTGLAKDQVGSVKFIIKTDAVKVSE